jgi:hypothetical protein
MTLQEAQLWTRVLNRTPTYRQVLSALKALDSSLSSHSVRRGAATYLSQCGFSSEIIGRLTLHTPQADESIAVRRYIDEHPNQPGPQLSMSLTDRLRTAL